MLQPTPVLELDSVFSSLLVFLLLAYIILVASYFVRLSGLAWGLPVWPGRCPPLQLQLVSCVPFPFCSYFLWGPRCLPQHSHCAGYSLCSQYSSLCVVHSALPFCVGLSFCIIAELLAFLWKLLICVPCHQTLWYRVHILTLITVFYFWLLSAPCPLDLSSFSTGIMSAFVCHYISSIGIGIE